MKICNLTFAFEASDNYFFKDDSVTFDDGKVHFIEGDNGVGKSTFFSILRGMTSKTSKLEVSICMQDVTYRSVDNQLPTAFLDQVHMVRQQYDAMLANRFSVIENLQLANLERYPSLKQLPEAIMLDVLHKMSIDMDRPVHLLSGGQRQLLAILMVLQKPTKILLLDEPTATLDKQNAQLIMKVLHQLAEQLKITMLIICHDKELVAQYGKRVMRIEKLPDGRRQFVVCNSLNYAG